jgi:hypothetical protein
MHTLLLRAGEGLAPLGARSGALSLRSHSHDFKGEEGKSWHGNESETNTQGSIVHGRRAGGGWSGDG